MDIRKITLHNILWRTRWGYEFVRRGQFPRVRTGSFWFNTELGWFRCPDLWTPSQFAENFETEVRRIVGSLRSGLFVDVGANIGLYTIMAARNGNRVLAVEANANTFNCLLETITVNGLGRVIELINAAAWSEDGTVSFDRTADSTVSHVEGKGYGGEQTRNERVRAFKLDSLISEKPSLLKIDVEGAEPEVLKGSKRLIEAGVPVIFESVGQDHFRACRALLPGRRIVRLDWRNFYAL